MPSLCEPMPSSLVTPDWGTDDVACVVCCVCVVWSRTVMPGGSSKHIKTLEKSLCSMHTDTTVRLTGAVCGARWCLLMNFRA